LSVREEIADVGQAIERTPNRPWVVRENFLGCPLRLRSCRDIGLARVGIKEHSTRIAIRNHCDKLGTHPPGHAFGLDVVIGGRLVTSQALEFRASPNL
jgi:hypothetical protein